MNVAIETKSSLSQEDEKEEKTQMEVNDGNKAEEFDADRGMKMVFIFLFFYL